MAHNIKKTLQRCRPIVTRFGRKILLAVISIFLVNFFSKDALSLMDSIITPCKSGSYITIDSLYAYCGLPGVCGKKLDGEGQTALIQGYIDYNNVFDNTAYPMLPYQKFLIANATHGKTLEIWVASVGSDAVFKKIAENKVRNPDAPVYVKGVLAGFDMPVMGACHRGLKLNLTAADSLSYDVDGPSQTKP